MLTALGSPHNTAFVYFPSLLSVKQSIIYLLSSNTIAYDCVVYNIHEIANIIYVFTIIIII